MLSPVLCPSLTPLNCVSTGWFLLDGKEGGEEGGRREELENPNISLQKLCS